jgi:hypothetical protein
VLTFWPYVWQLDPGHTYDEHLFLALKIGCDSNTIGKIVNAVCNLNQWIWVIFMSLGRIPMNIEGGLILTHPIYLLVRSRHWWIYVAYIHRWRDITDEYRGRRADGYDPPKVSGFIFPSHSPAVPRSAHLHFPFNLHLLACCHWLTVPLSHPPLPLAHGIPDRRHGTDSWPTDLLEGFLINVFRLFRVVFSIFRFSIGVIFRLFSAFRFSIRVVFIN